MPRSSKRAAGRNAPSANVTGDREASPAAQSRGTRSFWERLRRILPIAGPVGIVAIVAVALVIGADFFLGPKDDPAQSARFVEDQGTTHIQPGQPHPPYSSTPPTSGWHYDKAAPWGISDSPIADETQVHNLEHGGILVQYWCPDGCSQLVEQLKGVASRYKSKVILAPYAKPLPKRIALTAWNWIDTFDRFDERRITSFVEAHKNMGPEQVPD